MPEKKTISAERFSSVWTAVASRSLRGEVFAELIARYREPHRAYHTTQHLEECLVQFDLAASLFEYAAEAELSLWFHDAVYDPRANDNETESAQWAGGLLARAGASRPVIDRILGMIMTTTHNVVPRSRDEQLVADIDLSILGADEERFAEYEAQVRQEYAWVPEDVFVRERARLLQRFIDRPSIYWTDAFRNRLEERARRNLERALTKT